MDPATAIAGIGLIGSSIGGLIGDRKNQEAQAEANRNNISLAHQQMAFQERMANSAHQREAADLRAAGFNPILTATGGSGAASPSGASATVAPVNTRVGDILKDSMTSGVQVANVAADLNMKNASTAKTLAETVNTVETAKKIHEEITGAGLTNAKTRSTMDYDIARAGYDSDRAYYSMQKEQASRDRVETARNVEKAEAPSQIKRAKFDEDAAKYDSIIERVQSGLGAAASAVDVVSGASGRKLPRFRSESPSRSKWDRETDRLHKAGSRGIPVLDSPKRNADD